MRKGGGNEINAVSPFDFYPGCLVPDISHLPVFAEVKLCFDYEQMPTSYNIKKKKKKKKKTLS